MGDPANSAGEAAAPKTGAGEGRGFSTAAGCLVVAGTIVTVFVVVPYLLLALLFWAADGSWDFEGDRNFRYWFFVKGSRVEKLGLVAPTDKLVKYSVSESDGNFPGWTVVQYESKGTPDEIIDAYAKRCESLKAKVTERKALEEKDGETGLHLECEFKGYLTAEFFAGRVSSSQVSRVGLRIWGRE